MKRFTAGEATVLHPIAMECGDRDPDRNPMGGCARVLLDELHRLAAAISVPSLRETIRLLESDDAFGVLSSAEVREVASYRPIELEGEVYYRRAFTPGKEAAASLAFAHYLGREVVLADLRSLLAATGETVDRRGPSTGDDS